MGNAPGGKQERAIAPVDRAHGCCEKATIVALDATLRCHDSSSQGNALYGLDEGHQKRSVRRCATSPADEREDQGAAKNPLHCVPTTLAVLLNYAAPVAESADAPGSGPGVARRGGSSPTRKINLRGVEKLAVLVGLISLRLQVQILLPQPVFNPLLSCIISS